ncbi:tryptophan 2,3-dioxygenase family protein [Streptomyces sp. 7N604]|uniref:tryptophan 2,3-dioxygenase family protein n=1 Tax=Streptomyces sp. 7N604 TaxID=3457415 RepID=UPI003FD44C5E
MVLMTGTTYATYLHLDELLALQHPLTPAERQDVHDSERLFIVVHQASETLLSQVLVDLRHIAANQCGQRCFAHRAERATRLIDALEGQLTLLRHTLDREDFLRFRDKFGTASGLQSEQFRELFALTERVTTRGAGHPLPVGPRQRDELSASVRRWRYTHLELVDHMIGSSPGTGDTSGIRYLASRLNGVSQGEGADSAFAAWMRTRS